MAAITNGTSLMICQFVSVDLFVTLFCNESVRRELMAFFICQFVDKSVDETTVKCRILCIVDYAYLYNLVNKANLVHNLFLVHL